MPTGLSPRTGKCESSLERQWADPSEAGRLQSPSEGDTGFSQVSIPLNQTRVGEGKLAHQEDVRMCHLNPPATHQLLL